ncbi:MAG: prepilin-type N-terminal cleavage/methylation domain-containing protein [Phycisphaerales bacterium]
MSASNSHRGFTLIEVLIAVLVLAIGLLGIGAVFPVVVRQQRQAQDTIQGLTARKNAEAYILARGTKKELKGFVSQVSRTGSPTTITCSAPHRLFVGDRVRLAGLVTSPSNLNNREFLVSAIVNASSFIINAEVTKVDQPSGTWSLARRSTARDIAALIVEQSSAKPEEWHVPPVNLKNGLITLDQETIPLGDRLAPPPFSEGAEPQFVWDFAARLPELALDKNGFVAHLGHLELAVFVRRIDTGITLGQPASKKYTLSHVLVGDGIPANYRRVPVGVDANGGPTLNGTPNYATLQVLNAEPRENGSKLQFAKNTPAGLLSSLRQPGQKFADNTGLVHTVAKADDLDRSTVVLEQPLPPDLLVAIERDGFQLKVVVSPQVPAAVTVVKVSM